jgi:hypothetical protein
VPAEVASTRPAVPAGIDEVFVPARAAGDGLVYRPALLAQARLHYVDAKSRIDQWQDRVLLASFPDSGTSIDWASSGELPVDVAALAGAPEEAASYAEPAAAATRAANYPAWGKSLAQWLYQHSRLTLQACDALKLTSLPGESAGDFRTRCDLALREQRDAAVEALRARFAPKMASAQDALRRAEERVEREQQQASQQKLQTAVSIGATVLGALFGGGRRLGAGTIGRASTAARAASRVAAEAADVARAGEAVELARQRLADLEAEVEAAVRDLQQSLDPSRLELREQSLAPRKADILIGSLRLAWLPWRRGNDGFPHPAY